MKYDVALIVLIATLAIAFVCWTAFFAIYWVGESRRQVEENKALADFINLSLKPFVEQVKKEKPDGPDISDSK